MSNQTDQQWWDFQKRILDWEFWDFSRIPSLSPLSREYGPEMIYKGENYHSSPIKIVFLGYNPNYSDLDANNLVQTKKWIEERFLCSIHDMSLQQLFDLVRVQKNQIKGYSYFTGENAIPQYTMPLVVREIYNLYNRCAQFRETDPIMGEIEADLLEFTAQTFVWMNAIPFEGTGESGDLEEPLDQIISSEYLLQALHLLSPDLVLVFDQRIMKWCESNRTLFQFELISLDRDWLENRERVACRNQMTEKWIYLYHFTRRNRSLSPMTIFQDDMLEWIRMLNSLQ